ncbi:MAG: hypothetical protein N3A59_09150, partial [Thermodesulfovibrionales bacterium]|nr:hypothetical protein [Thermodesulfovibrionales bacterium]
MKKIENLHPSFSPVPNPVTPPTDGNGDFFGKKGCNLQSKGYNQAYNQSDSGCNLSKVSDTVDKNCFNDIRNNETSEDKGYNQIWLERWEVEKLLGISQQAISKAIKKGKFVVKEAYGNGGKRYLIALSSLPAEARVKYLEKFKHTSSVDSIKESIEAFDLEIY